jgi:hypothetical protein
MKKTMILGVIHVVKAYTVQQKGVQMGPHPPEGSGKTSLDK